MLKPLHNENNNINKIKTITYLRILKVLFKKNIWLERASNWLIYPHFY